MSGQAWDVVPDHLVVPISSDLPGNADATQPEAAPAPDAQPAAPQPKMWSSAQEHMLLDQLRRAKTPEEFKTYADELGRENNVTIPMDGPGGARDLFEWKQRGAITNRFAVPGFAKGQTQAQDVPDGMEALPSDAKVDYGTLSGLSPDEIKRRFESNPKAEALRRAAETAGPMGMSPLAQHGYTAGLDTDIKAGTNAAVEFLLHPIEAIQSRGDNVGQAYHEGRTEALARIDYLRSLQPYTAPIEEIGGALANPAGMGARSVKALAGVGAAYGGISGFENSNGSLGERATDAVKGAGIGAVAAPVIVTAIRAPGAVKGLFESRPLTEAGQAAERQGLHMLPADAGGPVTRGLTAAAAQTPLGAPSIISAAQRMNEQAGAIVAGHAADMGVPAAAEAAGQTAREGAQKYVKLSSRIGSRMYEVAASKAGDAKVEPTLARQTLDEQIARLSQVPGGGAGLKDAIALRQSLEGSFPVQALRDLRTEMFVAPELRGTPAEARLKTVVGALTDDVISGLRRQGKTDAADAFQAADAHWRDRLETIDNVIRPIIGRRGEKSGEQIIASLNAAMKGNNARAASFVRALPDEEQGVVRGSLLNPLGRDKDGNFSLSRFSTDWAAIGDTAKRAMFTPEARAALNDVATLGREAKASLKYSNHSNTARAVIAERTFGSVATGASIGLGFTTLGVNLAMQGGAGLLLSSPRFARWLARAPRTKVPLPKYLGRLSSIAAAEPAIGNAVHQFQARLEQALTSTPLAAQQEDNVGQPVPEQ